VLWVTPDCLVATPLPALPVQEASAETVRQLRRDATSSEATLWRALRKRGLGHKFRRQHPLGPFVLDFLCPALRLAVEIDGGIHRRSDQAAYDRFRQEMIEGYGLRFVRLSSEEVEGDLSDAVARITAAAAVRSEQVSYDLIWVPAAELAVGDSVLFGRDRREALIQEAVTEEATQPVYNLVVEKDGSYITEVCTVRDARITPSSSPASSAHPLSSLGEGNEG
jgi:very-short-patch-repair endonuclease